MILALAFLLPVIMMAVIATTMKRNNLYAARMEGPCDIYTAAGFPCVTAHSTTRALYASYNGPLYQVKRQADGKFLDIGVARNSGGHANAAAQDDFCKNTLCWITTIYDQSGNSNHLVQAPPGTFRGPDKGGFNTLPIADMAPITIMGQKVYGTYIMPGMGLRNNDASGLGINDEPEGIYMVFDGTHFDSGCCFNYGNTSTNSRAVGRGTMSTVYFGTSTAWGKGEGSGPWIMSDMEAGLFSGYNTKENSENPTIDSWRFVTGMVNGGGGNLWEIRGGNAQEGALTTFYKGVRPESRENNHYYPMHKKGAIQLGNGGDNGNGSAGTFYEGVVTRGYPTDAVNDAIQANIVAAGYDVPRVNLSRITTFTPGSIQEVTLTYTNTTGAPVSDLNLSLTLPKGWNCVVSGSTESSKVFLKTILQGEVVRAVFEVTSPASPEAGYLWGKAEWKSQASRGKQSETNEQRVRNVFPVKINEVQLNGDQFIELYNASGNAVDISKWTLINTRREWAPVTLATIPEGANLPPNGYYLLRLANSGLAAPANRGETVIRVLNTDGFEAGQQIEIGGEMHRIKSVGTAASEMALVYVPVPTGPWLTIPRGATNLPVTDASGFEVGQKIGIDLGGNYEEATVTNVGKAATLTNLAEAAKAGDTVIKVISNINMTVGDTLTIGTGARKERVEVKRLINVVAAPVRSGFGQEGAANNAPGEVELTAPLKFNYMLDVDVSDRGTGISFTPATRYEHKSGDAVQALGSGIVLEDALNKNFEAGTAVVNPQVKSFQGQVKANQWYGAPLSATAGSVVLMTANGDVVVDAMIYGPRQTNSSANGTITSPEVAVLEGDQSQGGCIVVPPVPAFGSTVDNMSLGRYPDGSDTDSNCDDFLIQKTTNLALASAAGSNNIKVTNVEGFNAGQNIIIGSGPEREIAVIEAVGTAGGTTLSNAAKAGATVLAVSGVEGFSSGQTITIGKGEQLETAVVASTVAARRRYGRSISGAADSIRISSPLKYSYNAGIPVCGSGITLSAPIDKEYKEGTQLAGSLPTPGEPNHY